MKYLWVILAFLLFLPGTAHAAEFRANVDRDKVESGDSLTLQLTLSGAQSMKNPDFSALAQSFNIISEGHSSSTEIFNGKASTTTGWILTLVPKTNGQAIIPAIIIETDAGSLRSEPVTVDVLQNIPNIPMPSPANAAGDGDDRAITISAEIDNAAPYKNQPVHYTVRAYARADIMGVTLKDPVLDNAIIERQGQPEMRDQTINGQPVRLILFRFLVTPLQPGPLTIPPAILQGQVQDMPQPMPNPYDNNAFADPFALLQRLQSMSGFGAMKPFSIKSNVIALNVAAPPVAMDPWLPLDDLKIHEEWDERQQARVGEPLTRSISLLAQNGVSSQLPSLKPQQNHTDFKVYADKPRTGNDTDKTTGATSAWRDESYSLIPSKYGRLILPAISIPYWNLKTDSLASADLPARIIDVQPAAPGQTTGQTGGQVTDLATDQATGQTSEQISAQASGQKSEPASALQSALPAPQGTALWLYAAITLLLIVLVFAVFWAISMQRQIRRIAAGKAARSPSAIPAAIPGRAAPAALTLEAVNSPQELKNFLESFARGRWTLPANASLESIFNAWPKPINAHDDRQAMAPDLGASLYANQSADIADLKHRVRTLIAAIPPDVKRSRRTGETLPGLNPD